MSKINYAEAYTKLHRKRDSIFSGRSILPHVDSIRELVLQYGPRDLIDYGCGKGIQYEVDKVQYRLGRMPLLYDIGVPRFSKKPVLKGTCGIICTDVLEHIAEEDLPEILTDIFSFKPLFAFFSVSCKPAKKSFPDGRNLHLTLKNPIWWNELIRTYRNDGCHLRTKYIGEDHEDH